MATNRIDILDSALLRPGRIDRKIEFPPPNEVARADILRIHSRKMNLMRGINLLKIAEKMTGSSGAEVKVSHGLVIDALFMLTLVLGCVHGGGNVCFA
jgi:26S proteasome regulatory subunit T6